MEAYLNVAEFGDGHFGAEAAAQGVFGVAAADLTPTQAARLAAILPSPNKWRAGKPGPYVRRRASAIEQRMRVVQADGLDGCVLPRTAPPRKPKKDRDGPPPLVEAPSAPEVAPSEMLEPLPPFPEAQLDELAAGEPSVAEPSAASDAPPAPPAHVPSRIDPPVMTP
jgi:monofunctional biosynthetic peptidoglycan transglycosylase